MKNFIYRLFVQYFLPKHRLVSGQYLKNLADEMFRVEKCFYNEDLMPVYICVDKNGNIREVPSVGIEKVEGAEFD